MIFELLSYILQDCDDAKRVMDECIHQLTLPITVRNTDGSKAGVLTHEHPVLFTGSCLTTVTNNLANLLIYMSIRKHLKKGKVHSSQMPEIIQKAAAEVGYIVTCEVCECNEDVQFLKRSPDEMFNPVLNSGVILRSVGTCDGDLPGRGSILDRIRSFMNALVLCYQAVGRTELTEVLAERFVKSKTLNVPMPFHLLPNFFREIDLNYKCPLSLGHICKRYRISPLELSEYLESLRTQPLFTTHYHPVIGKILEKDYGLTCPMDYKLEEEEAWLDQDVTTRHVVLQSKINYSKYFTFV